ncbi:hypothetical protein C8R48DRAFT_735586 [Suillus tomentosus]|nr:hypothetical protein C8R48DRAFT_735586 [Suillus tomentosus]
MSGHSVRAGDVIALAITGMTPDLIQIAGQWPFDELTKYMHQHAFLLNALLHGSARAPSNTDTTHNCLDLGSQDSFSLNDSCPTLFALVTFAHHREISA